MATLLQFSQNIRKRGSQIQNETGATVKRAAKRALKVLITGTRVDTGLARSNWRVSLGGQTRSVIPPYNPGKKQGIGEAANRRAALAAGNAVLNRIGRGKLVQSVKITNSVYYIDYAVIPGTVEEAVAEAEAEIRNFSLKSPGSESDLD